MTRDHLNFNSDSESAAPSGFSVVLGGPVILIPPALAEILQRLPFETAARVRPLIASAPGRPAWLFPGRGVDGHASGAAMLHRMRAHGIRVGPSRTAALVALASDLPAPVVSDLLNLSIPASVKWSRVAARDWQGYVAALQGRDRTIKSGMRVRQPFSHPG